MKSTEFIVDAIRYNEFPDSGNAEEFTARAFIGSSKIENVTHSLSIFKKEGWLTIVKDNNILLGGIHLTPCRILNKQYQSVDIIYILPEFRHTSAIKWLIYATKEYAGEPVVADGAIFNGGEKLIMSLGKHGMAEPRVLNKTTGEKTELKEPINNPEFCYIFESTQLGPGKNYFSEDSTDRSNGWIWYAFKLFEDI